jgi:hypothetical protein
MPFSVSVAIIGLKDALLQVDYCYEKLHDLPCDQHHPLSDTPIQFDPQQPAVPVVLAEDRNICFIQEAVNICVICQSSVKWMIIHYPSYCGETGYLGNAFMRCSDY